MSILPTFLQEEKKTSINERIIEIPKEYGINYETGQLTGEIVEGAEAVKVWCWLCLHTERFRFPIYQWSYGTELEQYIGQTITDEYLQDDCRGNIEEALLVNPWIDGISDFKATIEGDHLSISLTINTKFGEVDMKV